MKKYLVSIRFELDDSFMPLIPRHRAHIQQLMESGRLESYAVSLESQRSWIVLQADDAQEARNLLQGSPLYPMWEMEFHELFVYDAPSYHLPAFQMN